MKKLLLNIFSAALLMLGSSGMYALNLPVKQVGGQPVYYYTAQKGDKLTKLAEKIGVTKAQILEYNPQVSDGIIPGTVITFPVTLDATVQNGYYVTQYKVNGNESVYGVAKHFDIPLDQLMKFNPGAETGIKGMTLTIPLYKASADAQPVAEKKTEKPSPVQQSIPAGCYPYLVKVGDTLPRIARANGLLEKDVLAVNPDTDFNALQVGDMIYLPQLQSLEPSEKRLGKFTVVPADDNREVQPAETNQPEAVTDLIPVYDLTESDSTEVVADTAAISEQKPLTIAVMLPFMLNENEPSRTAQLYTEFYRGFLMGAEELSHTGSPVKISAYDTENSPEKLAELLNSPATENVNIFIGPDNQEQLRMIADKTEKKDDSYLLNIFAVKDDSYKNNSSIIQANIPHPAMYRKAIDSFIERYPNRIPVFISRVGGSGEKIEFTDSLKARLKELDIEYQEINFKNFLGRDNLEKINPDTAAYVFIPGSGSRQEFSKFAPALKNLRNSAMIQDNVVLYGYPEYIMFRGDNLELLHNLRTTIYSRYLSLPDFPDVRAKARQYVNLYGEEMEEAVPMQALIGYDTARFLINSLRNNDGSFSESSVDYDGVQMGYSLEETDNGGLVNENLYLIEYQPGGTLAKIRL